MIRYNGNVSFWDIVYVWKNWNIIYRYKLFVILMIINNGGIYAGVFEDVWKFL